jgi:pimeloyl-ACP methyl ester carboxylesterase
MAGQKLVFKAGAEAYASIRRDGFAPERIGTLVGASGGAKWLVLSQIDRVIADSLLPRLSGPVHLVGTSIGAWRFACYAQRDPAAAIDRFETAYIEQQYSDKPDIREITAKSREILSTLLGDGGVAEILDHPVLRTHIIAVRARNLATFDTRFLLATALVAAASLNALDRRLLAAFFERALFFDTRDIPPFFDVDGFPLQRIRVGIDNLEDAIVATGSIPLVLSGVRDIEGARPGVYRDGGIIDYHMDIPHCDPGRLALYPHFYGHMVPGWFDKRLARRKPRAQNVSRTVLVSPSDEFVAGLPNAKIPDRFDFERYSPSERVRLWKQAVRECAALADEFHEVIENGLLEARLTPLD